MSTEYYRHVKSLTPEKLKVHEKWLAECIEYNTYHTTAGTYTIIPDNKMLITCVNGSVEKKLLI
jgi:hypothetical protein